MKAIQLKAGALAPAMHLLLSCLVISAMLIASMPVAAQKNKDKRFEEIKSEAQRLMDEIKVPGTAIGIINDGKVQMVGLGGLDHHMHEKSSHRSKSPAYMRLTAKALAGE